MGSVSGHGVKTYSRSIAEWQVVTPNLRMVALSWPTDPDVESYKIPGSIPDGSNLMLAFSHMNSGLLRLRSDKKTMFHHNVVRAIEVGMPDG